MAKTGLGISGASEKVTVKTIDIPKFGGLQCDFNLCTAPASLPLLHDVKYDGCFRDQHLLTCHYNDQPEHPP
jgi:hypothetical protein